MKKVYGYIRVSDKKQEDGASLSEQKRTIKEYAQKNNLKIIKWYSEVKTAAKTGGRPIFTEMMKNLTLKKVDGVIIHKIDRSARNLHDWADIGGLIDNDIDVFFAHESLNLNERGGRLSADIQAVMASDYVRNLRQETIKGLYGRLKQGFYPWRAPVGYIDNGKGQYKTLNLLQSKLVQKLFELYITQKFNVKELSKEMEKRGLKNKKGNRVCKNGITKILKNPFYTGLMRAKDQTFKGGHEPLIDTVTFKRAQMILSGRTTSKGLKHHFLFRKQIRCEGCGYILSGERQKGRVYYRCQSKGCPTKTIREDIIEGFVENILSLISLSVKEINILKKILVDSKENWVQTKENLLKGINLQESKLQNKQQKLLDMYLDGLIDNEDYKSRKKTLLFELQEVDEKKKLISHSKETVFDSASQILELCISPLKAYRKAISEEKREFIEIITSNLSVRGRKVGFTMVSPFFELANRDILFKCAHSRDTARTITPKIIYTDNNTSAIVPKPLNKEALQGFYSFLIKTATTFTKENKPYSDYEI